MPKQGVKDQDIWHNEYRAMVLSQNCFKKNGWEISS